MHQNEKVLLTGLCAHLSPDGVSGATCHPQRTPRHAGGPNTERMSCLLHRGGTPLGHLSPFPNLPPLFGRETLRDNSISCDISISGLRHIPRFPKPRTFSLDYRRHYGSTGPDADSVPEAQPNGPLSWALTASGFLLGLALGKLWLQVRGGGE